MLVIGLDGATFDLVRPWVAAGHLPHLARLLAEGASGLLESTLPPVTAAAWASYMTGKHPAGHGVFDFFRGRVGTNSGASGVERSAGVEHNALVNARDIASPTLWSLLSRAGLRVGVLNVPITYPPEPVNGFLVPGLLSPDQGATTYPPGLLERYRAELGPYRLTPRLSYRPGNEAAFIADMHDVLATQLRYALRLALDHPTDLLMVHFLVTDIAQHALWRFLDPTHPWYEPRLAARYGNAVCDLFAAVDDGIGRLWGLMPADGTVIVLSDHGFGPVYRLVNLNLYLLDCGLLALKPQARLRYRLCRNRLLCPLAWRLAHLGGREKLIDFDDVDWSHTHAYARGHLGQVYINLQGREPGGIIAPTSYLTERQRVAEALRALRDPASGEQVVTAVIPCEEAGDGPYQENGPDLHVIFAEGAVAYPLFAADGRVLSQQRHGNSGDHRRNGLLVMAGSNIRRGVEIDDARIIDLAPTILHLFGLPAPPDMDGRVLCQSLLRPIDRGWGETSVSATSASLQVARPETAVAQADIALTSAEQLALAKQLRALGYLG